MSDLDDNAWAAWRKMLVLPACDWDAALDHGAAERAVVWHEARVKALEERVRAEMTCQPMADPLTAMALADRVRAARAAAPLPEEKT